MATTCAVYVNMGKVKKWGRPRKCKLIVRSGRHLEVSLRILVKHIELTAPPPFVPSTLHSPTIAGDVSQLSAECPLCLEVLNSPIDVVTCGAIVCSDCCCTWLNLHHELPCPCCYGDHLRDITTVQAPCSLVQDALKCIPVICSKNKILLSDYATHLGSGCAFMPVNSITVIFSSIQSTNLCHLLSFPKKSCLIVTPQFEDEARIFFGDLGVQIVNGHRFLGGVIGDCMTADDFVRKKVAMWVDCVKKLSKAATKSPQAAYTALSKSLQCEWSYLQRVMVNCGGAFVPLQDEILKAFYPALFEGDLSDAECKLFSLPTCFAGLGINNPTETASSSYHTSTQGTKVVVEAIKGCGEFSSACHLDAISKARHESRKALDEIAKQKLDAILATLSPGRQRAIMRVVEGKTPAG